MIISPAKRLDFADQPPCDLHTQPRFLRQTKQLLSVLRAYHPEQLRRLMNISPKLAQLNAQRYRSFRFPFDLDNARQAIYCFQGDVYQGLDVASLTKTEVARLQARMRILSGLFGLLKPLDLIQPYRLEMGTKLPTSLGEDLYQFWGKRLTDALHAEFEMKREPKVLINLASDEYTRALPSTHLAGIDQIQPRFKDYKNGVYKVIYLFAKKARGMMARYLIQNDIRDPEGVLSFNLGGYRYSAKYSERQKPVFLRKLTLAA